MASDTVPAAADGPHDPTPATPSSTPTAGGLAGLLAPVAPARTTAFSLDPTTDQATPHDTTAGASSDTYHASPDSDSTPTKSTGSTRQQTSIARAWLLAGAERWKKGADARNKRLDVQKARAAAHQVKESRTVNRSEKITGGNSSTGTNSQNNAGKSLNSKTSKSDSGGSKNSTKNSGRTPGNSSRAGNGAGGSANGGAGSAGTGGRSKDSGKGNGNGKGHDAGRGSDRKHDSSRHSKDSRSTSGGGTGKDDAGRKHGQDKAGHGSTSSSSGTGGRKTDRSHAHTSTQTCGDSSGITKKPGKDDRANRKQSTPQPGQDTSTSKTTGQPVDLKKPEKQPDPAKDTATDKAAKDAKTTKDDSSPKNTPKDASPTSGKPLNTQTSRETGYRDGTRAGRVAAHVEAYRDGVRDGWTDTRTAAAHDKARLDQAHQARKQQNTVPPMPSTPPTPPHPEGPPMTPPAAAPIQVTGADTDRIHLGQGAGRPHLSRGEVRSMAGFQKRLTAKTDILQQIAERAKTYEAHAAAQTKKVTRLLEQAKTVKGGDKLVAALAKLEEAAQVQEGKAREVHKRAVRGAEACTTVGTNIDTRYGDIYKAAIDSTDGTAELAYYQDLGMVETTHA